jgi:hypothetical protein
VSHDQNSHRAKNLLREVDEKRVWELFFINLRPSKPVSASPSTGLARRVQLFVKWWGTTSHHENLITL